MFKKNILVIMVLLWPICFVTAHAENYKLGVVLFLRDINKIDSILDEIKQSIASNDVFRQRNGNSLQLVVQTEIRWKQTNPNANHYDFSMFVEYAEKLKARGIKWSPLFSPHYTPDWVKKSYQSDLIRDKHGKVVDGNFLVISPSSQVWRIEAKQWIDAGLEALSAFIGDSESDVISEIFVTNEMMYAKGGFDYGENEYDTNGVVSVITSYDDASIAAWKKRYGTEHGNHIPRNLREEGTSRKSAFMLFRAEELAYCLNDLRNNTKDKLSSMGFDIPVTWKLVPYAFDKGAATLEQYHGILGSQLRFLFNQTTVEMIGIDEYQTGNGWTALKDAINKVRKYDNFKKPIYLAEFNRTDGDSGKAQLLNWIRKTRTMGVTHWTFFSWNGGGKWDIKNEQREALKQAFNEIIPSDGVANDPGSLSNSLNDDMSISFSDVSEGDYFYDQVEKLVLYRIMSGKTKDHFFPNDPVTRAEFIKMVIESLKRMPDFKPKYIDDMDDMPRSAKGQWYFRYLLLAYGLTNPTNNNEFLAFWGPAGSKSEDHWSRSVTREEAAHILMNAKELLPVVPQNYHFTDVKSNSPYKAWVYATSKAGIFDGYPDGSFKPKKLLNKGEAAKIIYATFF